MSDDLLIDEPPAGRRRWILRWFGGGFSGGSGGANRSRLWRLVKWVGILLVAFIVFYYPVGMVMVHKINDDSGFGPGDVPKGASRTVAMAAALIDREVNQTGWPANDPWFFPGHMLDNMPNFQEGEILALQKFAIELRDQIGRARGTSSADPDLQDAASSLSNKSDIWIFDLSRSWAPLTPSESYYRQAMKSLLAYNARLASGQTVFEPRADSLISALDRIGKDLGDASADIDTQIDQQSGSWVDWTADDKFYLIKGKVYAYALLLRALGDDFADVLKDKAAEKAWTRMVNSLFEGSSLRPWVVINGRPDALMQPNHLAAEGFYLLRARAQLEELSDILIK
jgi:hypothetical protein